MQQQTDNFAKFGKSFQDSLCQLMLEDRPFCDQITEVLTIDFLETKYLQVFVKTIVDYRSRYNVQNHEPEVNISTIKMMMITDGFGAYRFDDLFGSFRRLCSYLS